jgi:hypothetical protein
LLAVFSLKVVNLYGELFCENISEMTTFTPGSFFSFQFVAEKSECLKCFDGGPTGRRELFFDEEEMLAG